MYKAKNRFLSWAVLFALCISLVSISASASDPTETDGHEKIQFTDIFENQWFYDDVLHATNSGIMQGETSALFSPYAAVSKADAVSVLYRMCGEPEVVNEPGWVDVAVDSPYAEAADWAFTYEIADADSPQVFSPEEPITREQLVSMLFQYADYRYYDLSKEDSLHGYADSRDISQEAVGAFKWAVGNGIIVGTGDGTLSPQGSLSRGQLACILTRFDQAGFTRKAATANGIDLIYPSSDQKIICPKRDFYVIGEFSDGVVIPEEARFEIRFTSNSTGELLRLVFSTQKDFKEGMYVDYQELLYEGDREALRNSYMPDLVYDGKNLSTFKDTWRKCYFNDDIFTGIVYGGTYLQDINRFDQNGKFMTEFSEGSYTLDIEVTNASGTATVASYSDRITIGTIPDKVLSPFAPESHLDFIKSYAREHDMVCFLDPFPGYWNTGMFLPDWEWEHEFEVEIVKRWSLADRQEYFTGRIHFFNWNVPITETSYAVEIGQLTYDRALTDPNRLVTYYYSQGETSLPRTGNSTFLKMDPVASSADERSVYIARVDHNTPTGENVIDLRTMNDVESVFDFSDAVTYYVGETIGINGICNIIVPDAVTFEPDTESFTMSDRIMSVRVTASDNVEFLFPATEIPVSLKRTLEDGSTTESIFEFKYNTTGNGFAAAVKEPFTLTFTALNKEGEAIGAPATISLLCKQKPRS